MGISEDSQLAVFLWVNGKLLMVQVYPLLVVWAWGATCVCSMCCEPVHMHAETIGVSSLSLYLSFSQGWGILPPEPIKAVTTRNEMFERHHAAR